MLYEGIIDTIDQCIDRHKDSKFQAVNNFPVRDIHYFIQGLEVAKQIIIDEDEFAKEVVPHEIFEETVRELMFSLDRDDMEDIIDGVFTDEGEDAENGDR
jgi:hypothetical protein